MLFNYIKLIFLFCLCISTSSYALSDKSPNNNSDKKIVFLISTPRALSVAFLRMMYERGDFKIYNENFTNVINYLDANTINERMKELLLEAKHNNIFLKDVHVTFNPFVGERSEFVKNKNVYYIFLIRNPHHAIISYYSTLFRASNLSSTNKGNLYFMSKERFKSKHDKQTYQIEANGIFLIPEGNKKYTVRLFVNDVHESIPGISLDLEGIEWEPDNQGVKKAITSAISDKVMNQAIRAAFLETWFLNQDAKQEFYNSMSHWYSSLYRTYHIIKKEAVNKPLIIYSEELYEYPKETIENLCQQINIPYSEASLSWNKLDDNFNAQKEWNDVKPLKAIQLLHADAIESQGFHKPRHYEVDKKGVPTFSEIKHEIPRELLKSIHKSNLMFYELFLAEKPRRSDLNLK